MRLPGEREIAALWELLQRIAAGLRAARVEGRVSDISARRGFRWYPARSKEIRVDFLRTYLKEIYN